MLFITGLLRGLYGEWRFRRVMSGVVIMVSLTLVISGMVCTLLIGGTYAGYLALQQHGWEPLSALLCVGGVFATATALLIALAMTLVHRVSTIPHDIFKRSPALARTGETVEAFLDGLLKEDSALRH